MVLNISDIPTILVIAGIVFIFLAIAGRITGKVETSIPPDKQNVLGIIGAVLLVLGLTAPSTGIFFPPEKVPISNSTPTATPIATATPSLNITITSPKEGEIVPVSTLISGIFSGEIPKGQYMWVVINPEKATGKWWPQGGRITPLNGQWDVQAVMGVDQDKGTIFKVMVILVNETDDQHYFEYLARGEKNGSYPAIPLPAIVNIINSISVIRE